MINVPNLVKQGRDNNPTKLYQWLRIAVEDTQRLANECSSPELTFVPKMEDWNCLETVVDDASSEKIKACHYCMAGAALMGTGRTVPGQIVQAKNEELIRIQASIDALRRGTVYTAVAEFYKHVVCKAEDAPWKKLDNRIIEVASVIEYNVRYLPIARASDALYLELAGHLERLDL